MSCIHSYLSFCSLIFPSLFLFWNLPWHARKAGWEAHLIIGVWVIGWSLVIGWMSFSWGWGQLPLEWAVINVSLVSWALPCPPFCKSTLTHVYFLPAVHHESNTNLVLLGFKLPERWTPVNKSLFFVNYPASSSLARGSRSRHHLPPTYPPVSLSSMYPF